MNSKTRNTNQCVRLGDGHGYIKTKDQLLTQQQLFIVAIAVTLSIHSDRGEIKIQIGAE